MKAGDAILDLGTGTGVLLPFPAKKIGAKGSIAAVDLSPEMLKLATRKCQKLVPKPTSLMLDFEKQPIQEQYNHIIMCYVWPHLETPIQTLRMLRRRNLLPGGNILIGFPCNADRINAIHNRKTAVDAHALPYAEQLAAHLRTHNLDARLLADTPNLYLISIPTLSPSLN